MLSPATGLLLDGARLAAMSLAEATRVVRETAAAESVIYAEDFLLRRTNWLFSAPQPQALERLIAAAWHSPGPAPVAERAAPALPSAGRG